MSIEWKFLAIVFAVLIIIGGSFLAGAALAGRDKYCITANSSYGVVVVCGDHPPNVDYRF